jgi:glycerol kinase
MSKYLMALDQGTTSSRCIIFDRYSRVVSVAQKEFTQIFPKPGWVEHDAEEIWETQFGAAKEALAKACLNAKDIAAIGVTNQRETAVVWDKTTGRPVHNAIVWQCRRTAEYCDELKAKGFDKVIREKTGLITDAYFSATKAKWLFENLFNRGKCGSSRKSAETDNLLFGTVDTWLIWKLTNGRVHATDYTNAARTMMFNIHTLEWDRDILREMEIPENILPEVKPSAHVYGYTDLFGGEIAIAGAAGDQHAALFGQCCFGEGNVKNTYGTGCFILMNTGKNPVMSRNGLLTTIAWGIDGGVEYALEGSVFIGGAAVQWLRDGLKIIGCANETEVLAHSVESTEGCYFVPAFVGLGAPYWDAYARGTLTGLTRGTTRAHIVRAALEAIAYQSDGVFKAMAADSGRTIRSIRVDGGACANDFLMQFQADISEAEVLRPETVESTALGAAYLAGLGAGFYKNKDEIKEYNGIGRVFKPQMGAVKRDELLSGWKKAVGQAMFTNT